MSDKPEHTKYTAIIHMTNYYRQVVVDAVLQEVTMLTRYIDSAEYLYSKELNHIHFQLNQLTLNDLDIEEALEKLRQRIKLSEG